MQTHNIIKQNIKAHDLIYNKYEQIHGEIFNPIEQQRLHGQLARSITYIKTTDTQRKALDYGCGSGNLTKHLIDLGLYVTSADISDNFLKAIQEKYGHTGKLETLKINGEDLSSIEDDYFDFVATYSVLHHIPDYMKAVAEMIRVVKPGGVVYLDHEPCDSYWQKNEEYEKFLSSLPKRKKTIKRFFVLSNYTNKIRRLINPRYEPEGDIHIWGDDHIEWDKIEKYAKSNGCSVVIKEDYLLYKRGYPEDLYQLYKNRCQDMTVLVLRKDDLPKRKK